MHIGGLLIKQFDAFLHLFRSAVEVLRAGVVVPAADQFALNRVLAGLGGPPAPAEVELHLESSDSLPALCLFLALHPERCPVGVTDPAVLARLRQFAHIVAHAMVPMAQGGGPGLGVEEVAAVLTGDEVAFRPLVTYNEDGEVAAVLPAGGRNPVRLGPAGGPYKVVVNPAGSADLDREGRLHPVVVRATWQEYRIPFLLP